VFQSLALRVGSARATSLAAYVECKRVRPDRRAQTAWVWVRVPRQVRGNRPKAIISGIDRHAAKARCVTDRHTGVGWRPAPGELDAVARSCYAVLSRV